MALQDEAERFFGKDSIMSIQIDESPKRIVVKLFGPLDLECSQATQDFLSWIVGTQPVHCDLIVDMENVKYISSTGVGALTIAMAAAKKRGLQFYLRGMGSKVRSIFSLLGLLSYFEEDSVDG